MSWINAETKISEDILIVGHKVYFNAHADGWFEFLLEVRLQGSQTFQTTRILEITVRFSVKSDDHMTIEQIDKKNHSATDLQCALNKINPLRKDIFIAGVKRIVDQTCFYFTQHQAKLT